MKHVLITRQSDGYRASIEEQPDAFGWGADIREAVGDLVVAHPEVFDCVLTGNRSKGDEADAATLASTAAKAG